MPNLPFGFATPEESPGFLLWQATMVWQRMIKKALDPHGVSHAQFVIMATLLWFEAHGYETTQTAVIHQTKLDKMTVSKSMRKLVEMGFIRRTEHEQDTRAKNAYLTEQGKAMMQLLVPIVEGTDARFFGAVTASEEKALITILAQLIQADGKGEIG